jgi:hypothetical protein
MQPGTDTSDELSKLNPPLEPGNHPDGHGTYMAMIMAAPVNGWGMVGIAPTSVKVFNVKALAAGQSTFSYAVYANSIVYCEDAPGSGSAIKVVNLSLGSGTQPTATDIGAIKDAAADAHLHGLSVVGAAGNDGGPVSYPAAVTGVLAVGGADANPANLGVFCSSSNRGAALGILAPGCGSQSEPGGGSDGLDAAFSDDGTPAWASGTSEATAIVSAVLASMRAYAPSISAAQAENCLTSTAVNGGNIDAAAAFRACGLGAVVSEGLTAYNAATVAPPPAKAPTNSSPVSTASAPRVAPLKPAKRPATWAVRPRVVDVHDRGGRLSVSVATVPRGARVLVDVERQLSHDRYRVVASKTAKGKLARLAVGNWDRVAVRFTRAGQRSEVAYVSRTAKAGSA